MDTYKEKEKQEENQDESLKTRIASHPLYGLLLETHLDCLKVTSLFDLSLFFSRFLLNPGPQDNRYSRVLNLDI